MFLNLLRTIFRFFTNPSFTGLLSDTRSQEEKDKDYLHEEREVTTPVDPFSNPQLTASPFPYVNQLGTSSCVPHAVTLALAIERKADAGNFAPLSPMFPYRLRNVYPQEGSIPQNIADLLHNLGAPLFDTLPTPQLESQANNLLLTEQMYTEAKIYKGLKYFTLGTPNDITTIAQIAQQGHGVAITIFSTEDEWSRQYPTIINPSLLSSQAQVRHEICVLPNSGFIKDGQKYVAIQDSAWFGGWRLRYLSEDFIKIRCYGALYWDTVQLVGSGTRPHFTFTQTLKIGTTNPEVKMMQELLISEGLLPTGLNTGYFGGYTLAGVRAFQTKYAEKILKPLNLTTPTGVWGSMCITVANQLCA